MIPLDHHFNELLNETVPFALPKVAEAPAKTVPTAKAAKPAEPKQAEPKRLEPDFFSTLTTSTMDCHCETEPECTPAPQAAAPSTLPIERTPQNEAPRSKVEISAERAVPFKIDTRMMINRPRLSLKESGLPISFSPADPDPSIVGESVLGLKMPSTVDPTPQTLTQEPNVRGEVPEDIIGLLEQQPAKQEKPVLKAFNPENLGQQATATEETKPIEAWIQESKEKEAEKVRENVEVGKAETAGDEPAPTEEVAEIDVREPAKVAIEASPVCETEAHTEVDEPKTDEFCPMLQVDRFAWPHFCLDMHPIIKTQLGHLGDQLIAKAASGKSVVAVVGSGPGAGSSSILLGLATALEATGQRVAIVDADINSPTLADSLGLQPEQGWETVASGTLPVEESLIDSTEDHIALLPLCLDESEKLTFGVRPSENERMNDAIQLMKEHYDLILVDLGSPEASDIAAFSNMSEWIDSAVIVHNLRDSSRGDLIRTKNLMRDYGVAVAGIAENFAPREACFDDRQDHRAA
jgi:Mrp family chromosome partitioning ATPase